MPGPMFADGNEVTLRTVEEADLEFVQRVRNDPAVRQPLTLNRPANAEQIEAFFENAISSEDGAALLVCREEEPMGMVALFSEDDVTGTATIAYWLDPEFWGNGYATEAVGLLVEYAFAERRLHKLRAEVVEPNDGSQRVLEKLGFQREGLLRDEKFVRGEHVDVHRFGLLADEWEGV
ncbi:GNAT family N-acetyltransferase [Halobacterium wangiae]|uniref:GNAT family N-acetyltransferase n=1 Tax=Halobacterium wangiae TaxID=2902623 RepID=UPI001E36E866|nr:GNAT family protein [Halobacterium wangiae]